MDFECQEIALLTGAGFTKNFGGLLAKEIQSWLFNALGSHPRLKQVCVAHQNYEDAYDEVVASSGFSDCEKRAFLKAILDAYVHQEGIIAQWQPGSVQYPVSAHYLTNMLSRMAGGLHPSPESFKKKSFVFTLNQDMFFERHLGADYPYLIPGIRPPYKPASRSAAFGGQPIPLTGHHRRIDAECNTEFDEMLRNGRIFYIKLHGSVNWVDERNDPLIVVGQRKESQLKASGILARYHDLFKAVLQRIRTLVVIGYGFKDKYVNDLIFNAVEGGGLRVGVISRGDLGELGYSSEKIDRYFQTDLRGIFPQEGPEFNRLRLELDEWQFPEEWPPNKKALYF